MAAIYVNIQGDEPLLEPGDVDTLVDGLARDGEAPMGTLAVPLADPREAEDANVVKVVCDASGRALYFSRARIPHPRHPGTDGSGAAWRRHIGIYAYRREFLLEFASWPSNTARLCGPNARPYVRVFVHVQPVFRLSV